MQFCLAVTVDIPAEFVLEHVSVKKNTLSK